MSLESVGRLAQPSIVGNVFQTDGAATENARREIWVLVLGTDNRGAWEERSSLGGSAMWISSLKYAGVNVARTLCAMTAVLYVMRCLTGNQCSDRRRGND